MDQASETKPSCPNCHGRAGYHLADGRKKCKGCGRKYTPRPLHSRLPHKTLRQLALYFWHMVPAVQVAEDLALNRKTVQRHYRLLRQAICRRAGQGGEGKRRLGPAGRTAALSGAPLGNARQLRSLAEPVFGLTVREDKVRVEFSPAVFRGNPGGQGRPRRQKVDVLFFAGTTRALEKGDLADFYFSVPDDSRQGAAPKCPAREILVFWDFARRLKKLYRGRGIESLPRFLTEVEFRFNNRDNPDIIPLLVGLLKTGVP